MVAFFQLIEESFEYMEAIEDIFTDELLAIFGGAGLDFGTLGGFLGVEYLSLIWVFIVAAAVITFAAGALGGSVDDGTMEFTLAQPVSRTQVVFSRYLALATAGLSGWVSHARVSLGIPSMTVSAMSHLLPAMGVPPSRRGETSEFCGRGRVHRSP